MEKGRSSGPHFLVVSFYLQGHVTPSLFLAKRLARIAGVHVTFSTAVTSHRLLFPSSAAGDPISYIPYSDGFDDEHDPDKYARGDYYDRLDADASNSLSSIVEDLAAAGRPINCVIYSCFSTWAAVVARKHGIQSVPLWTQPATAFAAYWHFFHGFESLVAANAGDRYFSVRFPCMPPLRICDLPSLATVSKEDGRAYHLGPLRAMCAIMDAFDEKKPKILINTSTQMEPHAMSSLSNKVDVYAIGPMLPEPATAAASLFHLDNSDYLHWLDAQPDDSVVYVSFGSMRLLNNLEIEQIAGGLKAAGRPYLWVLRRDKSSPDAEYSPPAAEGKRQGMVVEWCDQVRVLEHRAVGCFVTHCGWNSTTEALAVGGVRTVAAPMWMDQGTNAWLMEKEWGIGVRVAGDRPGGELTAAELRRCVDEVMGSDEMGENARRWKERLGRAAAEKRMEQSIMEFVKDVSSD